MRRASDDDLKPRSARLARNFRKLSVVALRIVLRDARRWVDRSSRSLRYAASVFSPAPRSAASMSRNSSTSASLDALGRRLIASLVSPSVIFDELVRRDRDDDLARLIFNECGEREYRTVAQPNEQTEKDQKSEKTRHDQTRQSVRVGAWRILASYDHVPEPLTRAPSRCARLLVYGTVDSLRDHSMANDAIQKPSEN